MITRPISMLAIFPESGHGKHVFRPEARDALATLAGIDRGPSLGYWLAHLPPTAFAFDQDLPIGQRLAPVLGWLQTKPAGRTVDVLGIYCHGYMTGLQLGATLATRKRPSNLDAFADALVAAGLHDRSVVALMACTTADGPHDGISAGLRDTAPGGDDGFADQLRDALCARGLTRVRVLGHANAGHATRNPYLRVFEGGGTLLAGTGGYYPVTRRNPRWGRWVRALREAGPGAFRHRMLTMSDEQIHAELDAMPA